MDLLRRLGETDSRVLYILLVVVLLIPMMKPLGLPLQVSQTTRTAFEILDSLDRGILSHSISGITLTGRLTWNLSPRPYSTTFSEKASG